MFCTECGTKAVGAGKFCANCGTKLTNLEASAMIEELDAVEVSAETDDENLMEAYNNLFTEYKELLRKEERFKSDDTSDERIVVLERLIKNLEDMKKELNKLTEISNLSREDTEFKEMIEVFDEELSRFTKLHELLRELIEIKPKVARDKAIRDEFFDNLKSGNVIKAAKNLVIDAAKTMHDD